MPLKGFHELRVADVRRETADAVSVALVVPAPLRAGFARLPGQYLTLRTQLGGEEVRRSYSICSGLDDGELRIAIKLLPQGRFSAWAHRALQPGHTIESMAPAGRFVLHPDPAAARSYLGVAAGSGITPVLSILRTVLAREGGSRFVLLYGSRAAGLILFREALEDLKDRFMARLSVVHVLSREQQELAVLHGRLDGPRVLTLLAGLAEPRGFHRAFLCGPPAMIEGVSAALRGAGVAAERILDERFTPDGQLAPPPAVVAAAEDAPFALATVVMDGVRTEVPVAAGETLLAASLRAGLDLPYSCRGGMCSTCRARVTEGAVRMAVNYALEPWETEAGYALTCQSRPTTARVTVDYDHV